MSTFRFSLLLGVLLSQAVITSCGGGKTVTQPEPPAQTVMMYSGVVTLTQAKDGCPLLVRLDPQKTGEVLIPIGLDEKYQREGLQLKFSYRPSRASSGSCMKGTPAILEDIHIIGEPPPVPKSNLPDK